MTVAFDSCAKWPCFAYELAKNTDAYAKTSLFAYGNIEKRATLLSGAALN